MTNSKNLKKPQYKLIQIKLDTGTSVQIGRASLENIELLTELQDKLLDKYTQADGSIGPLLASDEEFVSNLRTACSVLPIVGTDSYLDYDDIKENWEQLIVLFFNAGFDSDNRRHSSIVQPKVSELHFLPFVSQLNKYIARAEKETEDLQN